MARFRQRGSSGNGYTTWKTFDTNGNQNNQGSQTTAGAYSSVQTITDTPTPGFQKLRSQGKVIMNAVAIQSADFTFPNESVTIGPIPTWGRMEVNGTITLDHMQSYVLPSWVATRVTDAKAFTLVEAYSKVASLDFMSLVTVAEAGKTASMLSKPFASAERHLRKVIARKASLISRGMSAASAASAAWLEYRFGWKPLLYDMQGIMEAWKNNTQHYEKPTRKVARSSHTINFDSGEDRYTGASTYWSGIPMVRRYILQTKVASGVLYEITEDSLEIATARRMGLRLEDVPASIWELVPYSFVLDRFLAVGSWLQAITPKPGASVKGSWTTRVAKSTQHQRRLDYSYLQSGYPAFIPGGPTVQIKHKTLEREIVGTSPPAIPAWNPRDINLNQTVDHLALIFELFRGVGLTRK